MGSFDDFESNGTWSEKGYHLWIQLESPIHEVEPKSIHHSEKLSELPKELSYEERSVQVKEMWQELSPDELRKYEQEAIERNKENHEDSINYLCDILENDSAIDQ